MISARLKPSGQRRGIPDRNGDLDAGSAEVEDLAGLQSDYREAVCSMIRFPVRTAQRRALSNRTKSGTHHGTG